MREVSALRGGKERERGRERKRERERERKKEREKERERKREKSCRSHPCFGRDGWGEGEGGFGGVGGVRRVLLPV